MESQNEEPKNPQNSSILLEEMVLCDIVEDSGNRELGGVALPILKGSDTK
jgi:hypothetical protein